MARERGYDAMMRAMYGEAKPSNEQLRERYHEVLERNQMDEKTPFDQLPYYVTRELEQYGISDDGFLRDDEESLKNEKNFAKMDVEKPKRKSTRIYGDGSGGRIYGDGRYNTRQNGSLVDDYGQNQDNGYNFDEFDM